MALIGGLNPWALLLAAAAGFIFGAIWYTVLSKPWRIAAKLDATAAAASPPPAMLAATFAAQLVMAWLFAQILLNLGRGGLSVSLASGVVSGVFIWAGFILMPMLVGHMYQGASRKLTLIDGAHWLGVMVLQGAILGAIGLR